MSHAYRYVLLTTSLLGSACVGVGQTITNLGLYAGGEQDPSPSNGATPAFAFDTSGNGNHLFNFGAAWSTVVSPGSAGFDGGAASTFSYYFNGSARMLKGAPLTQVLTNWGIETWVRLDDTTGTQVLMVNGTGGDGYGLIVAGGNWGGLLGGQLILDGGVAVSNTWTHLALVADVFGFSTFYVNGQVVNSTTASGGSPLDQFSLGSDTSDNFMRGFLDQSRVFTYTGTFDPAALNLTSVPEPASYVALSGLVALGFCTLRRRRRA